MTASTAIGLRSANPKPDGAAAFVEFVVEPETGRVLGIVTKDADGTGGAAAIEATVVGVCVFAAFTVAVVFVLRVLVLIAGTNGAAAVTVSLADVVNAVPVVLVKTARYT